MSNNAGAALKYNFPWRASQKEGNDSLINMIIGERSGRQRDQYANEENTGKSRGGTS